MVFFPFLFWCFHLLWFFFLGGSLWLSHIHVSLNDPSFGSCLWNIGMWQDALRDHGDCFRWIGRFFSPMVTWSLPHLSRDLGSARPQWLLSFDHAFSPVVTWGFPYLSRDPGSASGGLPAVTSLPFVWHADLQPRRLDHPVSLLVGCMACLSFYCCTPLVYLTALFIWQLDDCSFPMGWSNFLSFLIGLVLVILFINIGNVEEVIYAPVEDP